MRINVELIVIVVWNFLVKIFLSQFGPIHIPNVYVHFDTLYMSIVLFYWFKVGNERLFYVFDVECLKKSYPGICCLRIIIDVQLKNLI